MEEQNALETPHIGRMIYMLSHQMKRRGLSEEDDCGLTITQRHVLKFILMESMHRDIYQKDVEEEFQVRRSTATGMLKLMEKKGLICRESVARDARLKKITPTRQAETLRAEILADIRRTEAILCKGVSKKEFEQCMKVLRKMFKNLSEMDADYSKTTKKQQGGIQERDE